MGTRDLTGPHPRLWPGLNLLGCELRIRTGHQLIGAAAEARWDGTRDEAGPAEAA
jgi:hypothetical protein